MKPKYRLLLALLLSMFAFCGQFVFADYNDPAKAITEAKARAAHQQQPLATTQSGKNSSATD